MVELITPKVAFKPLGVPALRMKLAGALDHEHRVQTAGGPRDLASHMMDFADGLRLWVSFEMVQLQQDAGDGQILGKTECRLRVWAAVVNGHLLTARVSHIPPEMGVRMICDAAVSSLCLLARFAVPVQIQAIRNGVPHFIGPEVAAYREMAEQAGQAQKEIQP